MKTTLTPFGFMLLAAGAMTLGFIVARITIFLHDRKLLIRKRLVHCPLCLRSVPLQSLATHVIAGCPKDNPVPAPPDPPSTAGTA